MERIDPEAVELPAWYRPESGGRAARSGVHSVQRPREEQLRADRITNGPVGRIGTGGRLGCPRLTPSDTIYSISPLHHPSGLPPLDPAAPVASRGATSPGGHPVRRNDILVGGAPLRASPSSPTHGRCCTSSSRPRHPLGNWATPSGCSWGFGAAARPCGRRVGPRAFDNRRRARALCVDTGRCHHRPMSSGRKIGAIGRPPARYRAGCGSPPFDQGRMAGCSPTRTVTSVAPAGPGETGMLLVETEPVRDTPTTAVALRDVFRRDDAWVSNRRPVSAATGDGDLWFRGLRRGADRNTTRAGVSAFPSRTA